MRMACPRARQTCRIDAGRRGMPARLRRAGAGGRRPTLIGWRGAIDRERDDARTRDAAAAAFRARPMRRRTRRSRAAAGASAARAPTPRRASTRAPTRLVEAIRAQCRRARRHRGFPARLFAVDQGGARPDGAGRGAAARAGCRDRRPADRGQARGRRLVASGRQVDALLVSASAWTLGITARIIQPGETPENILESLVKRLGLPAVRTATRQAMRLLGSHFVLGQTIEEALARAARASRVPLLLRHAGRGRAHRGRRRALFRSLCARDRGDRRAAPATPRCRSGPAFRSSCRRCIRATRRCRASACSRELVPRVLELARKAKAHDLNFTVDAEEADRLELSLDVIARGARRSVAAPAGTASGSRCRPIRSARRAVIDWLDRRPRRRSTAG